MLFRSPAEGDPFKFAVDTEGRLILANWEGGDTDYVICDSSLDGYTAMVRADVDYPVLNTWGTATQKAALIGDFGEFEIIFKGQHYNVSENGSVIEPQVEEYEP